MCEISITLPPIGHSLCHAAASLIAPALIGRDRLARPQALAEIDRLLAGELSARICELRLKWRCSIWRENPMARPRT